MLQNINKPTNPRMNKFALACTGAGMALASFGLSFDEHIFIIIGGGIGGLGTFLALIWPE